MGRTAEHGFRSQGWFVGMLTSSTAEAGKSGTGAVAAAPVPPQTVLDAAQNVDVSWSNPWLWVGLAVLVVVAALGIWFWRRNKKSRDPLEPTVESGPDPAQDWQHFFRGLPRELSRVLDQFETVFVFGDIASEKLEFVRQFSGNARRERQYGKRVSYVGEALNIYLGDRCVVVVPSDSFVDNESARTDARWREVLRRTCRAHTPRAVVCLAPEVIKGSAAVSAWANKMRAHVDVISSVRGEAVPVSVVVAQGARAEELDTDGEFSPTDGLFELIASLRSIEGGPDLTRLTFTGIDGLLKGSEEQRRQVGQLWLQDQLEVCHRGWPSLMAQPDAKPAYILGLATLFKEYESYTGNLGGGLAELLYVEDLDTAPLTAGQLYLLPWRSRQFVGSVSEFRGVQSESGVRWYPTAVLRHRVAAATGFIILALGIATHYTKERKAWVRAATYARNYDPSEAMQRLETVADYAHGGTLPGFFDRQLVRCDAVKKVRHRLRQEMADQKTPETLLSFVSLYIIGTPDDCDYAGVKEGPHVELNQVIEEDLDQWQTVTKLQDEEIVAFLDLSCPSRTAPFAEIRRAISGFGEMTEIPDLREVTQTLQSLSKRCTLDSGDESSLERLQTDLERLTTVRGAGADVLGIIERMRDEEDSSSRINAPPMSHVAQELAPYRRRLELLTKVRRWEDELTLIRRELGPYLQVPQLAPLEGSLLNAFVEQREALQTVTAEPPLTIDGESVELWRVRAAMRRRSLVALEESLVGAARRGQDLFFSPAEMRRTYRWTSRRPGLDGVDVRSQVPERYTMQGFQVGVNAPLSRWALFEEGAQCPGEDVSVPSRMNEFVRAELQSYLAEYEKAWLGVYQSFTLDLQSERQLQDALGVLSQPTSPMRALLEEINTQTNWTPDKGFPFEAELMSAAGDLMGLKSAAEKKAQDEYAGLIEELALAGQAPPAPPSVATYGVDFDTTREVFSGKLSAFGQIVFRSYIEPKDDHRNRLNEWADSVHLPWRLRGPVAAPVRQVYRLGTSNIQAESERWWRQMTSELGRDVLDRFPFRRESRERAEVANVVRWLQPGTGRVDAELKPMLSLLTGDCARVKDCFAIHRPEGSDALLTRLQLMQDALFDKEGEAKPLRFELAAAWKSLRLVESRLTLGDQTVVFRDQGGAPPPVDVTWSEPYAPKLEVQVCAPDIQGTCERQQGRFEELGSSPWGVWELLSKAKRSGDKFTWSVATPQGRVEVTYDVCHNSRSCDLLLNKVFEWR